MSGDIYLAASAALAYEKRLEVVANNLANLNTAGFKRDNVSFQAYMLNNAGSPSPVNPPYPQGASPESFWVEYKSRTDFSPGFLRQTGNPFDLALNGKGFFSVQSPDGELYTRRGNFNLNPEGMLVTQEGWPVMGDGGEIRVAGGGSDRRALEVTVGEDGALQVNGSKVGRLRVSDFAAPDSLAKVNGCYFKPGSDGAAPEPMEDFRMAQGFLEMANVEAVQLMTEMIEIHRGYESYQRVIRSIDDLNSKSINEVGRTI
ncbi:MAG: flagellar basal-body rod protein FlgF [Deltaproteobacteria bacterium]|nr:flagellar basal-body rod protein FlgF [Deltaproteobacteria bacterium]